MKRSRRLNKRLDDLFPADDGECRVCSEPVPQAGRLKRYCSTRCRRIAKAVQRMFTWSNVRTQILERDDYACVECGSGGDLEVDHVEPIANGGHPLDESNLRTLCASCHAEKTARESYTKEPNPVITLDDYL